MQRRLALALVLAAGWPVAAVAAVYIPKAVETPGAAADEQRADRVWQLRGGLNVAALQCQFSPYLRTVDRYNSILKQHAKELDASRIMMDKYFRRTGGAKEGPKGFDRYNTRVYQSFATLDAQFTFCRRASEVGRIVAMQPIGKLHEIAPAQVASLREAMTPVRETNLGLEYYSFNPAGICRGRDGRC